MLFKPENLQPILEGRKTQTRRLWRYGSMVKMGGTYWAQTKLFDSSSRFARIRVTELEWVPLDPISEEDAKAEGYDSVEEFKAAFCRINKTPFWPSNEWVWRVKFEVVSDAAEARALELARMNEAEFFEQIRELAKLQGWYLFHVHIWPARLGISRIIVLLRDKKLTGKTRMVIMELKTMKGLRNPHQDWVLNLLSGVRGIEMLGVVRPSDWATLVKVLA